MLSGIRLIASAAARSVRAGGCAPRPAHPAAAAGQRNLVGFIRCLSASSTCTPKDDPGRKIRMRYDDIVKALQAGPLMIGFEVDVFPNGHRDCYLDTKQFSMCYLTPAQNLFAYGNVSLNWIITPDIVDRSAILLSNYVTQKANENTPVGESRKYTETSTQLISGGYNIQVLGNGFRFYFELAPGSVTDVAIYTYLNADPPTDKYYLQPTIGSTDLIVKTGDPQYIFRIIAAQPLPTPPITPP